MVAVDSLGLPVKANGTRYGMVEPHPFVPTPNVAARGHVCHLCNGSPSYIAHEPAQSPATARVGHECDDWHDGYCSLCCRARRCPLCQVRPMVVGGVAR